jgi:NADH dehydrogenase (ubiquinone) 1 alpha subcomplex subunit 2
MKKNNPQTPIMIREAAGTIPKVYARYGISGNFLLAACLLTCWRFLTDDAFADFGNEKAQSLEGLTDKQIEETVTGLVKNGA